MKDFFIKCLEDLESLTGLRQLYFLQSDEDGKRKVDVLIAGMIEVTRKFDYIPEEAQMKIIRRMMVEDQQYDSLNSRTVHKWLDMHKDKFYTMPKITEEELTPAPPEVAEKYAAQILANLSGIAKHVPQLTPEQVEAEGKERKDPYLRGAVASGHASLSEQEVVKRLLHNAYLRANYHPITKEKLQGWMSEKDWIEQQTV